MILPSSGLRELSLRRVNRRPLRRQLSLGVGHVVGGLVDLLPGDETGGREPGKPFLLAPGGSQSDLGEGELAAGLGDGSSRGRGREQRLPILEAGEDLPLLDDVTLLHQHFPDDARVPGGHLDHTALDIDLAAGDRSVA